MEPVKQEKENREPGAVPRGAKRSYTCPRLTEYGSIAKLTQGVGSASADNNGTGFKMSCL